MDGKMLSAVSAIKRHNYPLAKSLLQKAAVTQLENPEIFNLLGICYENEGNLNKASRYYRVAYYMDQNFKAAERNLDRVCEFFYKGTKNIEWGMKKEEEEL